jgi:hypothetical protein
MWRTVPNQQGIQYYMDACKLHLSKSIDLDTQPLILKEKKRCTSLKLAHLLRETFFP